MKCRNKHTLSLKYSIKVWIILLNILDAWELLYLCVQLFTLWVNYIFARFLIGIITFAYFLFYRKICVQLFFCVRCVPSYSFVCLNGKIIQIYGYVNVRWKTMALANRARHNEFSILSTIFVEWTRTSTVLNFQASTYFRARPTLREWDQENVANEKGILFCFLELESEPTNEFHILWIWIFCEIRLSFFWCSHLDSQYMLV